PLSALSAPNSLQQRKKGQPVAMYVARTSAEAYEERKRIMTETKQITTVSDFFVERLSAWGVERIFGHPGDGINGILGALNRAGNHPAFIQAPHEELASLMACVHAKLTGQIGVCLATQGPGAIHLLNGLYDAKLDH